LVRRRSREIVRGNLPAADQRFAREFSCRFGCTSTREWFSRFAPAIAGGAIRETVGETSSEFACKIVCKFSCRFAERFT
jgi:hypothetical protein